MEESFSTPWFWSLSIGLTLAAIALIFLGERAQQSVWPRLLICMCVAAAITPLGFPWTNGHNAGGLILAPAVIWSVYFLVEDWRNAFAAILIGVVPVSLVAAVLLAFWTILIRKSRRSGH